MHLADIYAFSLYTGDIVEQFPVSFQIHATLEITFQIHRSKGFCQQF